MSTEQKTSQFNSGHNKSGKSASATKTILRRLLVLICAIGLGWVSWFMLDRILVDRSPIIVGILHSQTGPMAVSEQTMIDAEILALEEINAAGGLLGRPVEWIIADGASDWPKFAQQAENLIQEKKVCVIFGCWTSASRKSVLPIIETNDHLLVYPMAYEGLEQSPNIIYTGAAPNQQITPAVQWCHDKLSARRFFLVGSDYIWPHCVNAIISDQLIGLGDELVAEKYVPFGSTNVDDVVKQIVATKPDVVLSTVVGDSAIAFAKKLREAGVRPEKTPVLTFAIGESELRTMSSEDIAGNYASWTYFQSINRPENLKFVEAFKSRFGEEKSLSGVTEAGYNSVKLWAQAVQEAGTDDVGQVRQSMRHQSFNAPGGIVAIDPETQHAWLSVCIGRIRTDGQFDIVWTSKTPVRPVPFPISRTPAAWKKFVQDLYTSWGGKWAAPVGVTNSTVIENSKAKQQ